MESFTYNDLTFTLEARDGKWDLACGQAYAAAGLFPGAGEAEALEKAKSLVRTVFPVGIRSVGPDVNHPNTIGDLRIVGPDVTHPNFIYWNKESVNCPRQL